MNDKDYVRACAAELGFSLCAVATVTPAPHGEFFLRWLDDGCAAGMAYLQRRARERLAPAELLPGARSWISLGFPYRPVRPEVCDWRRELRGRIAAYALGSDYHDDLHQRLRLLIRRMQERAPHIRCRPFVDTGPVLERDVAWSAGLGWFGRNTNLLHRRAGSWFFLAEVLTTWELEPDPPARDYCGSCTRCLASCPTGALEAGYRLDARKCISYWTIEHRGPIPHAMRPALGNWVFGCDDCQDTCPWNEKWARLHGLDRSAEAAPYLPELLLFDEAAFRARFRHTAVYRARREGLARNAAVVLGNTRNPEAVPPLAQALEGDPSPVVRGHAAWALGQIDDCSAERALRRAYERERDTDVREEIRLALGAAGSIPRSGC